MCQSNVYVRKGDKEALLMEDVATIEVEGSHVHLKDIVGNEKSLHARLAMANLVDHAILLEPVSGMPHDLEEVLDLAKQFHGHLGPYLVFGIRMGLKAKEILGFEGHFDVRVTAHVGSETPVSCMADGLQFSTGATLGKGNIELAEKGDGPPSAVFEAGGKRLEITLTEKALELTSDMGDRHQTEEFAVKAAAMPDDELFSISE